MLVKCFWCGADNDRETEECSSCGRNTQWSNFFKALLRPSVGYLLGSERIQPVVSDSYAASLISRG